MSREKDSNQFGIFDGIYNKLNIFCSMICQFQVKAIKSNLLQREDKKHAYILNVRQIYSLCGCIFRQPAFDRNWQPETISIRHLLCIPVYRSMMSLKMISGQNALIYKFRNSNVVDIDVYEAHNRFFFIIKFSLYLYSHMIWIDCRKTLRKKDFSSSFFIYSNIKIYYLFSLQ